MKTGTALLLVCLLELALSERTRYDGYKVIKVTPKGNPGKSVLDELWKNQNKLQIKFWNRPTTKSPFEILVPPHRYPFIFSRLVANGYQCQITRSNIQSYLDEEWTRLDARFSAPTPQSFTSNDFNRLEDIHAQMDVWASNCPAGVSCRTGSIGSSYESRPLKYIYISSDPNAEKKAIWIDSTIHAREWIATTTNLKFIENMVLNYSRDSRVTQLLNEFDWYFLPVLNPDGYVHTWNKDRYWRKSRNPNSEAECPGTDLNRNYDAQWMHDGASNDPCSDLYAGKSAASEPETQASQNFLKSISSKALVMISMHTAAKMWLHPWGHTSPEFDCARTPDHAHLTEVANAAADATEARHMTVWTRGSVCETIYPASGGTVDYAYKVGIKNSFTPELRGPGFDPGRKEIQPAFEETWDGVVALIQKAKELQ